MNENFDHSKTLAQAFFAIHTKLGKASMILSPLLFLVSELIHPVSQTETAKELDSVGSNFSAWFTAHILVLFAIVLLPFAVLNLMNYIRGKSSVAGYIGVISTFLGIVGVAGLTAFDLMVWQMGSNGASEEMINLYDKLTQTAGFSMPFLTIGPLFLVIGLAIISISLYFSGLVKKWKSLLVLIGILLYGLAGPLVPISNGHLIVIFGAILMFIGLCGMISKTDN